MKRTTFFLILLGLTWCFHACTAVDFDFNDPQDIETIQEEFFFNLDNSENSDLWELFGEENINFGPVPPSFGDSICFFLDSVSWITSVRYIFDIYHNNEIIPSHTDPPEGYDLSSKNVHLFYNQTQCISKQKIKTKDSHQNIYSIELDTVYITGHDSLFTAYYLGKTIGNGDPTVAMIFSGTLVYDSINTDSIIGVRDYLYGKKILHYDYHPTESYAPGTIEIKKRIGFSPCCKWYPSPIEND